MVGAEKLPRPGRKSTLQNQQKLSHHREATEIGEGSSLANSPGRTSQGGSNGRRSVGADALAPTWKPRLSPPAPSLGRGVRAQSLRHDIGASQRPADRSQRGLGGRIAPDSVLKVRREVRDDKARRQRLINGTAIDSQAVHPVRTA